MHEGEFISGWLCIAILLGLIGIGVLVAWIIRRSTARVSARHASKKE